MALRHAAEERFRAQLQLLGVDTPRLLTFGGHVMVKQKTWFHRGVDWKFPMMKARCLGPAGDMSVSSGGYVLLLEDGKMIRSTVVVQPTDWEALRHQATEDTQPDALQRPDYNLDEGEGILAPANSGGALGRGGGALGRGGGNPGRRIGGARETGNGGVTGRGDHASRQATVRGGTP